MTCSCSTLCLLSCQGLVCYLQLCMACQCCMKVSGYVYCRSSHVLLFALLKLKSLRASVSGGEVTVCCVVCLFLILSFCFSG
uniref:Secreted protein n=1 Tax=Ixodes ricinus TaxID=34613 RepID=A0A147BK30_IXORI